MEKKPREADYYAMDIFLYFIPLFGLYLVYRYKSHLKPLHIVFYSIYGVLSLMLIVAEVMKLT